MTLRKLLCLFCISLTVGILARQSSVAQQVTGEILTLERSPRSPYLNFRKFNFEKQEFENYFIIPEEDGLNFLVPSVLGDTNTPRLTITKFAPGRSMMIDELGVGIGRSPEAPPMEALHIYADDDGGFDQARILLENNHSQPAVRTMLKFTNNGGPRIVMENAKSETAWGIATTLTDNFVVSRNGTGGAELTIRRDGAVFIGPGKTTNFLLTPTGNLRIQGTLAQSSDVHRKENFRKVDTDEILNHVAQLPITSWNYRDDDDRIRHIGPVAQDFHRAFRVGHDDKTISTVDTAGVALAAIQALSRRIDERDERIEQLQRSRDKLVERTAELSERLNDLEEAASSRR